ncbi:MAG: hypothetical protein M3O50_07800 [Myxococcota bacterium]|nr:hypothetical protein [Myxococcota bacterium]
MPQRTAADRGERQTAPSHLRTAVQGWVLVLGLAVAVAAGVLAWLGRRPARPALPPVAGPLPDGEDEPEADWCAPGFEPIAGGGCFAQSPAPSSRGALLVYLHGRYAADASSDEVDRQRRLAQRATARGFSVLALRGRLGTCTAPELAGWYCWPSNERNADAAEAFVGSWARALSAARDRAGAVSTVLLGFSNGGYLAGLIASRALLDAKAVVVAHGGPVEPVRARAGAPPLLLLSADDDVAQDEMIRFDEELAREAWPHDSYARFGGHALTDEDIDAALAFFQRRGERLPLSPPLPLHRPIRHDRDGGVEGSVDGDGEAPQAEVLADDDLRAAPAAPGLAPAQSPTPTESVPTEPVPVPGSAPSELPSADPYGVEVPAQGTGSTP